MEKTLAQRILERHKKLKAEKEPWLRIYQKVGEFVFSRKQSFQSDTVNGQFLTGKIFDSTAANCNHLMASYLLGALWCNGGKTFQIDPPPGMEKQFSGSQEVKDYYEAVTKAMVAVFENAKAGFLTALEEYMLDQGAFGISGIGVFETDDPEMPCRFVAVDAKKISIDEGADGFIDRVYIEREITIRQLVQEFKLENVSEKCRKMYVEGGDDNKVKVLHAIEPRAEYDRVGKFGNANFPIASCHIEVDGGHMLEESGYPEMPVFVTRFWKAMGEKYGRSPSMECMPDIFEINALRQSLIVATEKTLNPPLLINQDGAVGGGKIRTGAGDINIRHVHGRMGEGNHKTVEQLVTIGDLTPTINRIAELREIIRNNYFIDRLGDLNNETRMTLGEADIRNELRGQSLGTIYSRQISELFTRIIDRVFNIMYNRKMLGVKPEEVDVLTDTIPLIIPEAVQRLIDQKKEVFKITFISPAARIMRLEELKGIQRSVEFVITVGAVVPDIIDNYDFDVIARDVQDLTGAPSRILKAADEVKALREAKAQQQAQMQQLNAQKLAADTAKSAAQAGAAASQAGIGVQSLV